MTKYDNGDGWVAEVNDNICAPFYVVHIRITKDDKFIQLMETPKETLEMYDTEELLKSAIKMGKDYIQHFKENHNETSINKQD